MQTQFVRVKLGIFLTWSPSFFENHLPPHPTPRRGQKSIVPGAQETTRPVDNLPRLPTSPGVPNSQGLSLSLLACPTSGSPSLSGGPYPCPRGHRRLPRALTHPAKGQSMGQSAAAASSHRADPHSLPSWPSGLPPLSFL